MILGIDVGGTHTDSVLMDNRKIIKKFKVLTDKSNILKSVLTATRAIAEPQDIKKLQRIVLSTTISTNAVVQDQLDDVALVVMNGPGVAPQDLPLYEKTRHIAGYMNHRGMEAEPVNGAELEEIKFMLDKKKVGHYAVIGKFSTRNSSHEMQVQKYLVKDGAKHVSMSHQLSGALNFPRRIATTYLNEAVWELHANLVAQLDAYVKELGVNIPLYILKADGGTIEYRQSQRQPVQTILSGPAATIMGVLPYVPLGKDSVSIDIGGTTTDIALFADGVPLLEPLGVRIEEHKPAVRGLLTHSIGVGGDSHVRVVDGTLLLGPERRGPAMAFDGPVPTPTDAAIMLGLADIGDKGKARQAMESLAAATKQTPEKTAQAVLDLACKLISDKVASMLGEINAKPVYTIHELLEGRKVNPTEMIVVGGPAPFMAQRLQEVVGIHATVPGDSDVINASGAAMARTTVELNMVADTEDGTLSIAEEGVVEKISPSFSEKDLIKRGTHLLSEKARAAGAREEDIVVEVADIQSFNVVRGYATTGKNTRVRLQVKPGLIKQTLN
ncbi:MAG: hydantoinase/oxoprolinase family protein [Burkholderiaceae bacterium]|jgi:N-methylhydantoinase A/oxoprolinase/acetone carboxylase beta subunit|nr:hydantoinase/oxoprolinase family protein [Burkholderiaceae bacterium]